jgi:hypothetical protein
MKQVTEKSLAQLRIIAVEEQQTVTRSAVRLAATLHAIYYATIAKWRDREHVPAVEVWGHADFHEYAEHELGMHGGTAMRYVYLHQKLAVECKIDTSGFANIGITKLLDVARVATPGTVTKWFKLATENGCCQLHNLIEQELHGGAFKRNLSILMDERDYKKLRTAMALLMQGGRAKTFGEAAGIIAVEWRTVELSRAQHIKKAG